VVRDSLRHRSDIEEAYLELIASAREEVLIASAYFFPGRRFRRALTEAGRRGVRVTLLLQGRAEYALLHYASRALYGSLLVAGVRIQEYHRSFMHAKVAVFDGRIACVGSSNIDPFSLLLAREANVFVDDTVFAEEAAEAHRQGTRLARAVRSAASRSPFVRTIDELDFTYQSTLRLTTIGSLLSPDFVTEGRSVIFEASPVAARRTRRSRSRTSRCRTGSTPDPSARDDLHHE
jgi:phosphatidylserine/phosphatidylglycerophosphate/cardiolipin synthase-like enzyme